MGSTTANRLQGEAPADADRVAEGLLLEMYSELRRLADAHMADEPDSHTLQPTALVHEAYLRLMKDEKTEWANRAHVFSAAARAMRRILVERARRKRGPKRGGSWRRMTLEAGDLTFDADPVELIALDEALNELEREDPRSASIVMLRFFAGLSVEEVARLLEVAPRTVKRDWAFARAWLHRAIAGRVGDVDGDERDERGIE
ncbi:MAG: ECF-type sigma factor [Planctomycetota bacterium]|nr:ECF-type sigma factor [Planctomycetota bacterium]